MNRYFPLRPNLSWLKTHAKDLLKAHRKGQPEACALLRRLHRYRSVSDAELLAADIHLHDIQFALALGAGHSSWDELKRHIQAVETAPAPNRARVKSEGNRTWIEGLPKLAWGRTGSCTYAGALEAALSVTSHPVSYTDLMGFSGLAFRVRWYRRSDVAGWCPSSAVGEFPAEEAAVAAATGWTFHHISHMGLGEENPHMERYKADIVQSFERGIPVIGYPDVRDLNVAAAYGIERDGPEPRLLWNRYSTPEGPFVNPLSQTGAWVSIPVACDPPVDRREVFLRSLDLETWRSAEEPASSPGIDARYLLGDGALTRWREDLANAESFTPEQRESLFFVSWLCFDALNDSRSHAAPFLAEHLDLFEGEARTALERAIAAYRHEAEFLRSVFARKEAFLGPWTGKSMEQWDKDARAREMEILESVMHHEAEAIGHLDSVLKAEIVTTS